ISHGSLYMQDSYEGESVVSGGDFADLQSLATSEVGGGGGGLIQNIRDKDHVGGGGGGQKANISTVAQIFTGHMLDTKVSLLVDELNRRSWMCIAEDTELVLASDDFWDEDVLFLRAVLRLEVCSVPEVGLFRAANQWASRRCQKLGLKTSAEHKRKQLGAIST
ncbi:unnamed protein product, partial [Polarella glacialis]